MSVELPASVEKELRDLAVVQSRDISDLVEEAVRHYIEAAAITDLEPEDVSEAQVTLVGELRDIQEWKDGRA
jgi:predicted transcriptional regulator